MSEEDWATLNAAYHSGYQSLEQNPDDPRWLTRIVAQATFIADSANLGLIPAKRAWIDYAAGGGQLSAALRRVSKRALLNFDRYMQCPEPTLKTALMPGEFDFVISTSVFEHVRRREDLDAINALVSSSGVMGVHTLVREEIPADPEWFYLLPVHCSFFTNQSMELLFRQWGYQCSIYNVESRLWLFFKRPFEEIKRIVDGANGAEGQVRYLLKQGFLDYWR
ncbi:methyltransferase domain-containing protein [Cupriavidus sp. MP-37]|uniref:methyltransferase domain-containing protein n=1 Tax=Cupriavidus sp. MP-37 TaxID=2884455 RepID=UPI001D0A6085|nr:methyltransferase domain-containing protein [Cupriavidus sp. MP-37]UDM51233.1 class I SAM-dependent methyltransferase [Cupriavidus sp. MP-37]